MTLFQPIIGVIFRFAPAYLLASLASVALLIGSETAQAADEAYTVTVTYGDLDLSSPAGAELLHGRIRAAARTVCGWEDRQRPAARDAWHRCYRDAIAGALATVHKRVPETVAREPNT